MSDDEKKELRGRIEVLERRLVGLGDRPSPTSSLFGSKILSAAKPKSIEFTSKGVDEALQGIASDAWGGLLWPGLRVPTLPTPDPEHRYLFLLCSFTMSAGDTARIDGLRNGWSMGFDQVTNPGQQGETHRIVEQWIKSPLYKGPDFNVLFHLRKLTINEPRRPNPSAVVDPVTGFLVSTAFKTSDTPALLYNTIGGAVGNPFYTGLTGYVPPNRGRPWGKPLGGLGSFQDIKADWSNPGAWHALDIPLRGPCRVALYASVQQGNPATRTLLDVPGGSMADFPLGLSAEEQFLAKWSVAPLTAQRPGPIAWRVAGALRVKFEDITPGSSMFRNFVMDGEK